MNLMIGIRRTNDMESDGHNVGWGSWKEGKGSSVAHPVAIDVGYHL